MVYVRYWLGILVLFALLVRAAVPFGFMIAPSHAAGGGLTVVICTAAGPQTVAVDEDGKPSPVETMDDTCPFAATAVPALAGEQPSLAAAVRYAAVVHMLARDQFSRTPQPGSASPRGPPASV